MFRSRLTLLGLILSFTTMAQAQSPPEVRPSAVSDQSIVVTDNGRPVAVRDLVGKEVRTPDGGRLGEIESVLFDQSGFPSAYVVSVGGFLGLGNKSIALPASNARVVSTDRDLFLVADLNKDQLQAAPEFRPYGKIGNEIAAGARIEMTVGTQSEVVKRLCLDDRCSVSLSSDPRVVDVLFATNRRETTAAGAKTSFGGERADQMAFGAARVRIPEDHKFGRIELPFRELFGFKLYSIDPNEKQHFILRDVKLVTQDKFREIVQAAGKKDALVFVHGFNTSFEEAVFRLAQITWDLQFSGTSILFSWPSRGGIHNYGYDQNSALYSRDQFVSLLKLLRSDLGLEKVHVLAHSMGNLVVLDSLASHSQATDPVTITELIMAAPDVDRDHFRNVIPHVKKIAAGLTLYASSADKALVASRGFAREPRAGDVPATGGPLVIGDVQTIDVTAIGDEIFGLNHNVFAVTRSLMNDMKLLLESQLRPPHSRLSEIRRVPEGSPAPQYWRYVQ